MQIYIKIHPDEEKKYYPCECDDCGWVGSSKYASGGGQIADTGDYDDIRCPCCNGLNIDECDNIISFEGVIRRREKGYEYIKKMVEKVADCDCSKHIVGHFEERIKSLEDKLEAATYAFECAQSVILVMDTPKNFSNSENNIQFEVFGQRHGEYQKASLTLDKALFK